MLIKSIFMELRSRLRSCNVYITTGVDFKKNCNLKISIQSDCIVLNYYDDRKRRDSLSSIESLSDCYSDDDDEVTSVIPIQEFCQIIPNSMSCLKIDRNNISFRILTEPNNGGNFYNEVLTNNKVENNVKSQEFKINFKAKEEIVIMCSNCSNVISNNGITFDRILELPSANLDMSDWFCHGHSHGAQTPEIALKPNKSDFLYRLTFFIINNSLLSEKSNKFNAKREVYHCNRCLAWLGLKNKDTVKLFNSEVKLNRCGNESPMLSIGTSPHSSTADFIYTVENMAREFNLGLQFTVMCKIVLDCTISANKKQYMLIWIMDKELQVIRNSGEYINGDKIVLQSSLLTKILYKVELAFNDEVESWLSDPSVTSTEVSKSMFSHGIDHFEQMSLKVPECFRHANGYRVSYLKV